MYPLGTLADMKDAGLRIRVQRDLRDRFLRACQAEDKPAAQVLREFMREYIADHEDQLKSGGPSQTKPDNKAGS